MKKLPLPKPGISPYFNTRFAYSTSNVNFGDELYNFRHQDNIPDCAKYDFPGAPLDFRMPPSCKYFMVVELSLMGALETLSDELRFELNPERWDRVKRDLSEGWCYMPWMSVNVKGEPSLMDGRHRINALMKFFGLTCAPFVVDRKNMSTIKTCFDSFARDGFGDHRQTSSEHCSRLDPEIGT